MSFHEKYQQASHLHKSQVCVGLDPDLKKIPQILLQEENPIFKFNQEIITATKNKVAAYKLNFAFYLSSGRKGIDALERTILQIPYYIPIILDVKTGDIGNTVEHYARAYFEEFTVDAVTVNPLMGQDSLQPFLNYHERMKFVLVLTSNPGAADYLKRNDLYMQLARWVDSCDCKEVGAVVGATQKNELKSLRQAMPNTLFLIPGIGAQGGEITQTVRYAMASPTDPRFLINSSRGIIYASDGVDFAEAAFQATEDLRVAINNHLA
jgi:orotidine-5'-phosphate decarboxylase